MNGFFRRCLQVAAFFSLLAGTARVLADSAPAAATVPPPAVKLDKGMPPSEIIKLIGQPTEVLPIPNTDGKAERWIYRWPIKAKPPAPQSYQVLTLLMINRELVVAQQSIEPKAADGK